MFLMVVPHIQELFFPESTVFRGTSDSHKANHVTEATGHCKWSNGVDTLASFTLPHGEKSSEFHILPCSLASFQRSIGTKASSLLPICQYVSQSLSHPSWRKAILNKRHAALPELLTKDVQLHSRGNSSHNNPKEVPRGTPEITHSVLLVFKGKNTTREISAGHVSLQIGNIIVTQVEFSNHLSMIFYLPLPSEFNPSFSIQFSPSPVPEDSCNTFTSILPLLLEKMRNESFKETVEILSKSIIIPCYWNSPEGHTDIMDNSFRMQDQGHWKTSCLCRDESYKPPEM